jgi:3-deoxy-7-phosphoheptulonate synthase
MKPLRDLHIEFINPLPSPADLCAELPPDEAAAALVAESRVTIQNIIQGKDPRFLVVIGPCSIHHLGSCDEYAQRLARLHRELSDRLFIVMRVYFEKPRTSVGWKGLIMDPHLDGSHDIPAGLRLARRCLLDVAALGLPAATELLDPITPQYIADLIAWSAIGARTSESQVHRQMASGLSMPLGFKNATPGTLGPAVNGIKAAASSHTFLSVNWQGQVSYVCTRGNPHCHLILRGGDSGPNYAPDKVAEAEAALRAQGLNPAVMIDASHANCGKDASLQPEVFREVVRQRAAGDRHVIGGMVESNLVAGAQKFPQPLSALTYGQSITDPCIGWETTEALLRETHAALPGCAAGPGGV